MMMNYRGRNKKRKFVITIITVIVMLLLINLLNIVLPQSIIRKVSYPIIKLKELAISPFGGVSAYFISKKSLQNENENLRQKNSALEFNLLREKVKSKNELEELKEQEFSPTGIQSRVLIRPSFSPYDTLVIENKDGIGEGDNVFIMGSFVGNVTSIDGNSAVVKLRSLSGEVTVVRVGNIDAEAIGQGGGRFTITVPKDVEVNIDDIVTVPYLGPTIMGVIKEIETDDSGSFKVLYFSIPVSLSSISFVTVVPN